MGTPIIDSSMYWAVPFHGGNPPAYVRAGAFGDRPAPAWDHVSRRLLTLLAVASSLYGLQKIRWLSGTKEALIAVGFLKGPAPTVDRDVGSLKRKRRRHRLNPLSLCLALFLFRNREDCLRHHLKAPLRNSDAASI